MKITNCTTGKPQSSSNLFILQIIALATFFCLTIGSLHSQVTKFSGYGNGTSTVSLSGAVDAIRAHIGTASANATTINISDKHGSFNNDSLILIIDMAPPFCSGGNNWEFNYISQVSSGTLTLKYALQYSYTTNSQVIQVPQYKHCTINATINCSPWDGSTGGVIPLMVSKTLTINGTIDASYTGFKAGSAGIGGTHSDGGPGGTNPGDDAFDGTGGAGIGKAGNGGSQISGSVGTGPSDPPSPCCGCNGLGYSATNQSDVDSKRLLMGGGGWSGGGGQGGGGGGGAGGDAKQCTQTGQGGNNGADGGDGSVGGVGGVGGGIVIIKAPTVSFGLNGKISVKGGIAAHGGDGGPGGHGGEPHTDWGAGAGNGGNGGNGGVGASGGAGGVVYIVATNGKTLLDNPALVDTIGGTGATGGDGGAKGVAGTNADLDYLANGCPCPLTKCACSIVWGFMNGAECTAGATSEFRNYNKPGISQCVAKTTTNGTLDITCTDLVTNCVYECSMIQDPYPSDPSDRVNPDLCLQELCNHTDPAPATFQQCDLFCDNSVTYHNICCIEGEPDDGRKLPQDGVEGTDGPDGKDADPGHKGGDDEPDPSPDEPPEVKPVDIWNVTCKYGNNGWVDITVNRGTEPYHYEWSNGETTEDIGGLTAGTYTVTVTDANILTAVGSWTVTEPPAVVVNSVVTNLTCAAASTGMVSISVTGGTPPYTYLWNNGAASQNISGLDAGNYTVTVTDANGCTETVSQTVVVDPLQPVVAPILENFEATGFPPDCWTNSIVSGSFAWARSDAASGFNTGTASAFANFFDQATGTYELKTVPFDISGFASPVLKFDYAYATYVSEVDEMIVYYSPDAGSTWHTLLAMPGGISGILNTGGTAEGSFVPDASQWGTRTLPLPAGTNMLKFKAISAYGNNLYLDNINIMNEAVVPANITVQNAVVTGNACYNATNVISVAGGGTTFTVSAGGEAIFIAGQKISFLYGTKIEAEGHLHGFIRPAGPYCGAKAASFAAAPAGEPEIYSVAEKSFFKVYPNPTMGSFSLELTSMEQTADLRVEMVGMHGERVLSAELRGQRKYELSLTGKPVGIYFIRVVSGKFTGTLKIVKH
ncbi:MAG: T9SS type A sorting domain-containing protein [Bacteroidetes bacterium]|nr:T9SS type A sorting domain-containing protein [Bacteroidota bacterium]